MPSRSAICFTSRKNISSACLSISAKCNQSAIRDAECNQGRACFCTFDITLFLLSYHIIFEIARLEPFGLKCCRTTPFWSYCSAFRHQSKLLVSSTGRSRLLCPCGNSYALQAINRRGWWFAHKIKSNTKKDTVWCIYKIYFSNQSHCGSGTPRL